MPCNISYYGSNKPGKGVRPIQTNAPPKVPFNAANYPINAWNGKHLPLRKTTTESSSSTAVVSAVRMFWRMAVGGDWIEQTEAPTNTSNYFWVLDHHEEDSGVHFIYMVEKAFPTPSTPTLSLYWDGVLAPCRPPTPAGYVWEVVSVDGLKIYNESRCLATIDLPGYCPVNDSLTLIDSDGEAISVEFVDGKATLPEGTVISGIDAATGDAVYLTAEADGSLSGFVGVMAIMDPDTGESSNYRVSSSGIMEA